MKGCDYVMGITIKMEATIWALHRAGYPIPEIAKAVNLEEGLVKAIIERDK